MSLPNPFESLYIAELIPSAQFPSLFSPRLLPKVRELLQPGNVVLRGTQGTGKSMLLSLLRPEIRAAYWQSQEEFPCDDHASPFIGAAINLTNSGIRSFTQLRFHQDVLHNQRICQSAFADFTGCWLLRDLLYGMQTLWKADEQRSKSELGLVLDESAIRIALRKLCEMWHWTPLGDGNGLDAFLALLEKRLQSYFKFLNFKITLEELNPLLSSTVPLADLLSTAVNELRNTGVLSPSLHVFLTIDQFEELEIQTRYQQHGERFSWFREVIDQALSTRNPSVSLRIGSRTYAWREKRSENLREYVNLDLDDRLRRHEHEPNDLFPELLEDILRRRLAFAKYDLPTNNKPLLSRIFGSSISHRRRAKLCVKTNPQRVLKVEKEWPKGVAQFLNKLAEEDILSAKLGEAWVRQQIAKPPKTTDWRRILRALRDAKPPWETTAAKWWAKERKPIAILQIAAANGQRVPYFGARDIVELSGRNTLVFATICREVWTEWLSKLPSDEPSLPRLDKSLPQGLQVNGIRTAAVQWFEKIPANPNGDTLLRLVKTIAHHLRHQLRTDKKMSYPGGNGISLKIDDLAEHEDLRQLLADAVATGNLQHFPHTSKNSGSEVREKWYLLPILSVFFGITIPRTKEPLYLSMSVFRDWLHQGAVIIPKLAPVDSLSSPELLVDRQKKLF